MGKCKDEGKKINGIPVDPCVYQDVRVIRNVTVRLSKCTRCGHEEWSWERQEDSYEEPVDTVTTC